MKKLLPVLAIGLSALFLTACDEKSNDNKGSANISAPASTLEQDRFLKTTFEITTQDDRTLAVSVTAYCEKLDDLKISKYREACAEEIEKKITYFADDRECFEGSLPAVSAAVRNHAHLPQNSEDRCYDQYPANYAPWTEDMMRRTLEMSPKDNLYTVTKIEAVNPS